MDFLQVRVGLVAGVAGAVVLERHDFVGRLRRAPQRAAVAVLVGVFFGRHAATGIFVDVIAQMQHQIEVRARRDPRIDIEEAERVVRAGQHRDAQPIDAGRRQRAGTPDGRGLAQGLEAVVVRLPGSQAGGIDLDRVVARRAGHNGAAAQHVAHVGRLGQRPVDADIALGSGRDAAPEHHAIGQRVTAGHAMGEHVGTAARRAPRARLAVVAAGRQTDERKGRAPRKSRAAQKRSTRLWRPGVAALAVRLTHGVSPLTR